MNKLNGEKWRPIAKTFPGLYRMPFYYLFSHRYRKFAITPFDHWMNESEYMDFHSKSNHNQHQKMKQQCERFYLDLYDEYESYILHPNIKYGMRFLKAEDRSEFTYLMERSLDQGYFFAPVFPELQLLLYSDSTYSQIVYSPKNEFDELERAASLRELHRLEFRTDQGGVRQ